MTELWDVNCMIGRWPTEELLFHDVAGLVRRMDELGIARAVVAHSYGLHYDPIEGNRALGEAIAAFDPTTRARLLPCWTLVPPVTGELGADDPLALLESHGVRAARLYPREHNYSLGGPDAAALLAALERGRILTLIDAEQTNWEELDRVAAAFPQLPIVVCQVGYRGLRRLTGVLERRPNCRIELSFFSSHQGLEWLVARLGPGRVLFGTGAPVSDGGGAVTRLLTAELGPAERAAIGGENLAALLGLEWPGEPLVRPEPAAATPPVQIRRGEPITSCDVLDAHAHVGPWFNFFTPDPTPEAMLRVMDRCGVRMAVLSPTLAIGPDAAAGNAQMLELVRRFPSRFAGYAVFNPHHRGSAEDVAAALRQPGVVGIKIHPDVHACAVGDPRYGPAWELAQRLGVPVLTHTFAGSPFCDPADFDAVAKAWPGANVILGHAGVTGPGHLRAIAVAQRHPNLYLEICGSYTTGHWIRRMVAEVGAERVLYGSDFPFIELRYALGRVVFAGLDDQELRLVLGGNARRLLRLPGPPQDDKIYTP